MERRSSLDFLKYLSKLNATNSIVNQMYKKTVRVRYTKNVPIGAKDYPECNDLYYINFSKTRRILILGQTGSGKSFLSRSIWNRTAMAGLSPVIMTDIKPEHYTSQFPLQDDYKKFLYSRGDYTESTKVFDIVTYYPYFLYKMTGRKLPNQKIFQLTLGSIQPTDLLAFIDYRDLSATAKMEVEDLVAQMMRSRSRFKDIDDLISYVQTRKMSRGTKKKLTTIFSNLKNLEIFGNKYPPPDFFDAINEGKVVNFNLYGWQRTEFKKYISLYLSLLIREFLVARQEKKIRKNKHIFMIFEELHSFCPSNPRDRFEKIIRSEIIHALNMGRSEKISFMFITQNPTDIPQKILDQVDYIFVPRGFDRKKVSELVSNYMQSLGYLTPYERSVRVATEMSELRKWRDGMREWLVIERSGDMYAVAPFAPLSHHKEEGEDI